MPPDSLVIQTHTPNVLRDLALLIELNKKCKLSIQITAESDKENDELQYYQTKERLRHMYSIESRLNALKRIKEAGLFSVGVVSPLMPLNDPSQFASKLDKTSNFVILDHYLLGDGSGGFRTKSRNYFSEPLPSILLNNNQDEWNSLDKFNEIVAVFRKVLGPNKLG
ncbi:MAG: hypothetical protein GWN01_00860, partial [Nitrosopumilaceae archaeon]|nr:hypothetical protein [Nitrosopumilaceae archaeon]NIU85898.1 hypothetical protein [Nitrosopumilaceae archaeon]NIV64734.1 hypothetical protein [Nitrosopumilaceae archaeon]NIX60131.1 hypothetical protein [Nitrosopumilaceae archaeon]